MCKPKTNPLTHVQKCVKISKNESKCVRMRKNVCCIKKNDMLLQSYTHFLSGCGLMIFPRAQTLFTSCPPCCPNEKRITYQQRLSITKLFPIGFSQSRLPTKNISEIKESFQFVSNPNLVFQMFLFQDQTKQLLNFKRS